MYKPSAAGKGPDARRVDIKKYVANFDLIKWPSKDKKKVVEKKK